MGRACLPLALADFVALAGRMRGSHVATLRSLPVLPSPAEVMNAASVTS